MKTIFFVAALFVGTVTSSVGQEQNAVGNVFSHYYELKDALMKGDATAASTHSEALKNSVASVTTTSLSSSEAKAWSDSKGMLIKDADAIASTKDISKQRNTFISLSEQMYHLRKSSAQQQEAYYQFCPMANSGKGAGWLSKDKTIKNPYYGSKMLTCGKNVETLK